MLTPLQQSAEKHGHLVKWFLTGKIEFDQNSIKRLQTNQDVIEFNPDAVIVPGNVVPDFWPGLKVQIFHGLGEEKKGHYRITQFFDLYCTPGPYMTEKFEKLAAKHKSFIVRETGWPKLDSIRINNQSERKKEFGFEPSKTLLLYAPTFSPKYTSAPDLINEITFIAKNKPYDWLIKFHPLMDKKTVILYQNIIGPNVKVIAVDDMIPCMEAADILLTDTSSVAYEFLMLSRPIITYRAKARKDKGINILNPAELGSAISRSMDYPNEFQAQRNDYLEELHPYADGKNSERVISAIEGILNSNEIIGYKKKKPNWFRRRLIRKMIK